MLGFFTDPFPDELLQSACARYHHRKGRNLCKRKASLDLFGKEGIKIAADFPSRLGYLAAQLPSNTYSTDLLIDKHTLLPLFLPFTSVKQAAKLRRDMEGDGGGKILPKLGFLTSRTKTKFLRFCISCVANDEAKYHQPYWHRVHQVPGVEVCPLHSVFLSDSDVPIRGITPDQYLVTAKQAITALSSERKIPRPVNAMYHKDSILLRIASSAASLLQTRVEPDPELLRRRYSNLLFDYDLSRLAGNVNQCQLTTQFLNYYPADLLTLLRCELVGEKSNWLSRLIQGGETTTNPLHNLLLIDFLGSTAKSFFQLPADIRPFGSAPWPCLNRSVPHFREPRIGKCEIKKEQRSPQITGTFTCDCGFAYKRCGFDQFENRRFMYDLIVSYGTPWYMKLQQLLSARYSQTQMATILGVTKGRVQREIARLRRAHQGNSSIAPRFARSTRNPLKSSDYLRAKHRDDWTKTLAAHDPSAGRKAMRSKAKAAFSWLVVNDQKWLRDNLPPVKPTACKPKKDWSTIDAERANEVFRLAAQMLNAPGPPVRVSQILIAKTLGIYSRVFKSKNLPKTRAAMMEVADTNASFAIRRIWWAKECFLREPSTPQMWKLWWRTHMSRRMARNATVYAEWQQCLQTLESHYNLI